MRAGRMLVVTGCLLLLSSPAQARPDMPGATDMYRYAQGDVVDAFPSPGGNFRIHFTRSGINSVPPADNDSSGVPDHVERVAAIYEQVLALYHDQLGFRRPLGDGAVAGNNGGDARFDVYLLDFGGKSDGHFQREQCGGGTCEGFMVQENDFAGYPYASAEIGNRVLASHEFFHAVQAAYDADQDTVISEGSAVWATEKFDRTLDDFESLIAGYLQRPDRSLDTPIQGPVDPFSYGAALFFEFLDERLGAVAIRGLWEDCVDGARGVASPEWFTALPLLLQRDFATSFAEQFATFTRWNLYTGARANPAKAWARGAGYPIVKMDNGSAPYRDDQLRLFPASARYLRIDPAGRARMTALAFSKDDLAPVRLLLVPLAGSQVADGVSVDLRAASPPPAANTAGADDLIVVLTNTAQAGDSVKGTLCVGTPDEVEACRPAGAPDLGAPDDGMVAPGGGGGGCSLARTPCSRRAGAGLLLVALALLASRRSSPVPLPLPLPLPWGARSRPRPARRLKPRRAWTTTQPSRIQGVSMRFATRILVVLGLLTSAPALAQVHVVVPGVRVQVAPPPPRVEMHPPRPSPAHEWIAGYWAWRGGQQVWMPGHWIVPPGSGYHWVAPRWANTSGSWEFFDGHWQYDPPRAAMVAPPPPMPEPEFEVRQAPPPEIVEVQPQAPWRDGVWLRGHWWWNGVAWQWLGGHWERGRKGHHWEPAVWEQRPDGRWKMKHGKWKH